MNIPSVSQISQPNNIEFFETDPYMMLLDEGAFHTYPPPFDAFNDDLAMVCRRDGFLRQQSY